MLNNDKVQAFINVCGTCLLTVDSNPLIEILSLRQHHSLPQVPTAQCSLGMLQQFILMGALWDVLLGLEGFG